VTVEEHSDKKMRFKIYFYKSNSISRGNKKDRLQILLLEPSVFQSAETLKKMKMNDFSQDNGKVSMSVPPIINPELAESLTTTTDAGGDMVNSMSSGNFVLSLIMGGSMQQLWGMIRAMQFIILSFLIKVPTPSHTHKFFEGCAVFAQMDILDGKGLYENWFDFKET
jgi:hypothetical protein